jgi:acyl carrier protein
MISDSRARILARLNGVFRDVFEDDRIEIVERTSANEIPEWDSLMHVVLVVAMSKEFGVKLSAAEVGRLQNVGEMLPLLEERATR